ncbi:hypothetical protein [Streptomyces sp. NBC_01431]|nr:hypothetical protein [Streptomyces sp. NBC_01431]
MSGTRLLIAVTTASVGAAGTSASLIAHRSTVHTSAGDLRRWITIHLEF